MSSVQHDSEAIAQASHARPAIWRAPSARWRKWRNGARTSARPKRTLLATLREWHKRAGLFAFIFMGWLGVSGILINQSASWGYDVWRTDAPWITALYGLHAEPPRMGFTTGEHWLATTADYTLLDGRPLAQGIAQPLGIVSVAGKQTLLFVATASSVVVLTADGQRYDELFSPVLPVSSVRRIGNTADGAVAVQDLDAWASDDLGNTWHTIDPAQVRWSVPASIPSEQRESLLPYAQPSVSLEHVLVDLHSGRLFGDIGVWIINLVGFAALWLSISGIWMWRKIQKNRNQGRGERPSARGRPA